MGWHLILVRECENWRWVKVMASSTTVHVLASCSFSLIRMVLFVIGRSHTLHGRMDAWTKNVGWRKTHWGTRLSLQGSCLSLAVPSKLKCHCFIEHLGDLVCILFYPDLLQQEIARAMACLSCPIISLPYMYIYCHAPSLGDGLPLRYYS